MKKSKTAEKGVILVLGSPNSDNGKLYSIAIERCELAIKELKSRVNYMLLLTGGFGSHFNTSNKPHALYLQKYLIGKGVPKDIFTEFAESSNTIEDAALSKSIVLKYGFTKMLVVTSDYHIDRAKIVFKKEYSNSNIKIGYSVSDTNEALCEIDLTPIKEHELKAIKTLTK